MKIVLTSYFALVLLFTVLACDNNSKTETNIKAVNLEVSGMTCEHACGGTIKKELAKLADVDSIYLDFKEDDSTQIFKVFYNANQIDVKTIENQVNQIAGGQLYHVNRIEELDSQKQMESGKAAKNEKKVALNQRMFEGILNGLKQSVLQMTKM